MATKKRRSRKVNRNRRPRKKSVTVKRVIVRRTVIRKVGKAKRSSPVTRAKRTIRDHAEKDLKDALFQRDQATSYKQHRTAQKKVDKARRELRRFK